jgi:hypothetical protein
MKQMPVLEDMHGPQTISSTWSYMATENGRLLHQLAMCMLQPVIVQKQPDIVIQR